MSKRVHNNRCIVNHTTYWNYRYNNTGIIYIIILELYTSIHIQQVKCTDTYN